MTALDTFTTETFITRTPAGRLLNACCPNASHDHIVRIRACGELDRATAPQLTDAVADASRGRDALSSWAAHPAIGLDLHRLAFCDLGGIRAFAEARAHLLSDGFRLCLTRPRPPVLRLLQLAGEHQWLSPDVECPELPWPRPNEPASTNRRPAYELAAILATPPWPTPRVVQQRSGNHAARLVPRSSPVTT